MHCVDTTFPSNTFVVPRKQGRHAMELDQETANTLRLQWQLDQWVDVATELYSVLEQQRQSAPRTNNSFSFHSPPEFADVTNIQTSHRQRVCEEEYDSEDYVDEVEALQARLREQSKALARQNADIKFARQTETSLRNSLFEKSCQLENITAQSQQLIQQLSQIETSLKKQQDEYQDKLKKQTSESASLETTCCELRSEADRLRNVAESEKQKIAELKDVQQGLRRQLDDQKEDCMHQANEAEARTAEVKAAKKRLEESKKLHDTALENLTELIKEKDRTITELKSMMARTESKSIQNEYQLQTSFEKIQNYEKLLEIQRQRTNESTEALSTYQKQISEMHSTIEAVKEENSKLKLQESQLKEETTFAEERSNSLQQQLQASQTQCIEKTDEAMNASETIMRLQQDIETLKTQQAMTKASETQIQRLTTKLGQQNKETKTLKIQFETKEKELDECKAQILVLERKLNDSINENTTSESSSPVLASMKRLQGLLYSRERDLRKSQLKVRELESELSLHQQVQSEKQEARIS